MKRGRPIEGRPSFYWKSLSECKRVTQGNGCGEAPMRLRATFYRGSTCDRIVFSYNALLEQNAQGESTVPAKLPPDMRIDEKAVVIWIRYSIRHIPLAERRDKTYGKPGIERSKKPVSAISETKENRDVKLSAERIAV